MIEDMETKNASMLEESYVNVQKSLINPAISFLFIVPVVILNVLAMVSLKRSKSMCRQINTLALNLAITDTIFGVSLFINAVMKSVKVSVCYLEYVLYLSLSVTMVMSLFTATLFGVDRFVSLHFSFRYYAYMTRRKQIYILAFFWLKTTCLQFYNTVNNFSCRETILQVSGEFQLTIVLFFLCLVLTMVSYSGIIYHIQKNRAHMPTTPSAMKKMTSAKWLPVMKTAAFVLTIFLCYLPIVVYSTLAKFIPDMNKTGSNFPIFVSYVSIVKSLIHPFLYVWRFKECRYQMAELLLSIAPRSKIREKYIRKCKMFKASYLELNTNSLKISKEARLTVISTVSRNVHVTWSELSV